MFFGDRRRDLSQNRGEHMGLGSQEYNGAVLQNLQVRVRRLALKGLYSKERSQGKNFRISCPAGGSDHRPMLSTWL